MFQPDLRSLSRIAYAHAALSIFSTITIGLYFALGGFWGRLNDANSILWMLTFVPLLLLFYRMHSAATPQLARAATVVGIVAAVAFALLQALLVAGLVAFQQTFLAVTTLSAVLGVALLIFGLVARQVGTLPSGLTWATIFYALAFIIGGLGFWLGGWEHPLGIGGFALTVLLGPLWGIRLGRLWRSDAARSDRRVSSISA